MKNRPSSHLMLLVALMALDALAYFAIYRAGVARGYAPSVLLACRDLALFLPIFFVFIWMARRHKYAGDLTLFTVAILLFSIGQFVQYRLFTDPEYGVTNRATVRQARLAKARTQQYKNINQFYDADKKRALFGDPNFQLQTGTPITADEPQYWTLSRIFSSLSTLIPLAAFLGFAVAFALIRRDDILLLLQRHSFLLGLLTTLPFAFIAIFLSQRGKSLGNTTPWEPVKITFLLSYAGILADHYRNLSRTHWGIPPWRFVLPFLLVAALPIIPFFALQDFGQMLVFMGAYVTLYVVAVRRLPQVTIAIGLMAALLAVAIFAAGIYNTAVRIFAGETQVSTVERVKGVVAEGVPDRIKQRFYLWLHGGIAPPEGEYEWWDNLAWDEKKVPGNTNEEKWYGKFALQPSQALFGVSDGRLLGTGLGQGYPNTVPIADSDFIYAAVAEEMGIFGGAIIICAFIIIVIAGMRTAIEARDMFTKLIAAGITSFLGFQAIVNIGGVLRMLPMTGITLPFVSHGGWSLITSFFMLGMLMAISHRNNSAQPQVVSSNPPVR